MSSILAPVTGDLVALEDVADEVFAGRLVGDGVAVRPRLGEVVAPIAGTVEKVFPGGHGIVVEDRDGVQVLVHVGLETVQLHGDGFTAHVSEGETVAVGDPLVTADLTRLAELEVDLVTPVVVISGHQIRVVATTSVERGEPLLEIAG